MASRREYEMLFNLNARLGNSYNSTFKAAQGSLVSMQKEIAALTKTQSDISGYQRQQNAIEANTRKLEMYQQQYDNIQKEMQETGEFSSALANKLLAKQQQIDRTSESLDRQREKLAQMGEALREAGINTDDLTRESGELAKQIEALKEKQSEAAEEAQRFGESGTTAIVSIYQALVATGLLKALQEVYEVYKLCIDASIEHESAMTGVAKTTDLTAEEYAAMSEEIKKLATIIPMANTEIAATTEIAGQLGIAKDNLIEFTRVMDMLGTATNMTNEEGATMLAQFAAITNMDPSFYMNLGSSVVDLGNNYSTTERNITEMSQAIAAAGAIANMSEADILGIAAAVTSLGFTAHMGGSSMTKLISGINSAVASGEGLSKWASVAGMKAEDFAKAWKDDAAGALDMFIHGLHDAYERGQDVYSMLSDLEINEIRQTTMITSLAKSGDRLTQTLKTANEAWEENSALLTEAEKRYATTQSLMTLAQNSLNNLRIAIGDMWDEELKSLYKLEADVLQQLEEFVKRNPELVKGITVTVGVLGAATAGLAGYTVAAKVATAATAAFGTISKVSLGPLMLGITAVAALAGGLVALSSATQTEEEEIAALTATSRAQYRELQDLEAQYADVKDSMGETSAEAVLLKDKLDEATEAYEENKQTAEELADAHREVIETHQEMMASYEDTINGVDTEISSNIHLINRLEEMIDAEERTAAAKEEVLAIVELLNEAVPELGLSYDEYADSLNMTADAIRAVAEAELEAEGNAARYEELKKFLAEEGKLYENLQTQREEALQREKELSEAQAAYAKKAEEIGPYTGDYASDRKKAEILKPYVDAITRAKGAVEDARAAEAEAQDAYKENQRTITDLTNALSGYSEEATGGSAKITSAIADIMKEMSDLSEAYGEAYEAAHESIVGQYDLWDETSDVVATSADSINEALESQAQYWQEYNENLASLLERDSDIEGLNEMIASFADGSEDSVNAIAGMADASDEELTKMVENWQALQREQDAAAGSLAEIKTDFQDTLAEFERQVTESISAMDLSEDAALAGEETINGYIDSLNDMLPLVEAAYDRIANAGRLALRGHQVGAVSASSGNALAAEFSGSSGEVYVEIEYSPQYDVSGVSSAEEFRRMLAEHDANLKEIIQEAVEEAASEQSRRAFR